MDSTGLRQASLWQTVHFASCASLCWPLSAEAVSAAAAPDAMLPARIADIAHKAPDRPNPRLFFITVPLNRSTFSAERAFARRNTLMHSAPGRLTYVKGAGRRCGGLNREGERCRRDFDAGQSRRMGIRQ